MIGNADEGLVGLKFIFNNQIELNFYCKSCLQTYFYFLSLKNIYFQFILISEFPGHLLIVIYHYVYVYWISALLITDIFKLVGTSHNELKKLVL